MNRTFLSALFSLVQDAGMRWLHALMVLVPLLIGTQGALSGFDTQIDPDAPQVLAGKRAGLPFTRKGKVAVKTENAERNDGKNRCENCGVEAVPAKQHQKGVTPPKNEAQVDHVVPRAKGGEGEPDNGQVLCRDCNIKKSDKAP
jgi:hypothetical protein